MAKGLMATRGSGVQLAASVMYPQGTTEGYIAQVAIATKSLGGSVSFPAVHHDDTA
jgi:hypothetical protein